MSAVRKPHDSEARPASGEDVLRHTEVWLFRTRRLASGGVRERSVRVSGRAPSRAAPKNAHQNSRMSARRTAGNQRAKISSLDTPRPWQSCRAVFLLPAKCAITIRYLRSSARLPATEPKGGKNNAAAAPSALISGESKNHLWHTRKKHSKTACELLRFPCRRV